MNAFLWWLLALFCSVYAIEYHGGALFGILAAFVMMFCFESCDAAKERKRKRGE